jgi:iron complex transport system substrate-binding protein
MKLYHKGVMDVKTKKKFPRIFTTVLMIGLLLIISACGKDNSTQKTKTGEGTKSSDIILDSGMGKATLSTNAKRVIAPYHEDALLALGVTPVAKWAIGKTVQGYLESDLKDVPTIEWNLPLEQVLKNKPDLIILENNLQGYKGKYEDYKKIAPTYVMTKDTVGDWRKQIEVFGKVLGKEKQAKKVVSDYDKKVVSAREQLKKSIGDQSVAVIWVAGNQFYLFEHNRHSAEVLYSELGVTQPKLVQELGSANATAWNPISLEKLSQLDADHVILLAQKGEQGINTLENSPVWQSTPAAKNGNIHILSEPSNWTNTGLLASKQTIDDVLKLFVK